MAEGWAQERAETWVGETVLGSADVLAETWAEELAPKWAEVWAEEWAVV